MRHYMLDVYNIETGKYSEHEIYNLICDFCEKFNLNTILKPIVIPYYHGFVSEDDGISGFVFLQDIGHYAFHHFEKRNCFFADIFTGEKISEVDLETYVRNTFGHNADITILNDIKNDCPLLNFNDTEMMENDFGPHFIIKFTGDFSEEKLINDLILLVKDVGMTPISYPNLNITEKHFSMLIVIAESHISIYCDKINKVAYLDVFSCVFKNLKEIDEKIKKRFNYEGFECKLISRGTKHYKRLNKPI